MKKKLYIVLVIFTVVAWGGLNYANYQINQNETKQLVKENMEFINTAVGDIDHKTESLEKTKDALESLQPSKIIIKDKEVGELVEKSLVSNGTFSENKLVEELERRINKLEKEKMEYLSEKPYIEKSIFEKMNIFKMDIQNPFINVVILPLILYLGKKILDILFRLLSNEIFEEEGA